MIIEMKGQTFGRLTVIDRAENVGKAAAWKCLCECGKTKTVIGKHLRTGAIRSCGCLLSEETARRGRERGARNLEALLNATRDYSS